MILAVTSDWHDDWVTTRVPRHEDVQRAALRSVDVAKEAGADFYLFAGDLCDPDDPYAVLRATALMSNVIRSFGKAFVAIPGNHDVFENGTGDSTLMAVYPALGWVMTGIPTMCRLDPRVAILTLPFAPTSHTYDPSDWVKRYRPIGGVEVTIVLSHLSVPGIQPGEETAAMPRGRDVVLPLDEIAKMPGKIVVINGHYHRAQTFECPRTGVKVHIPGSLVRLTHSEEDHEPSVLIMEV